MSILSGFRKQKRYATDEKGRHQLISTWTHTDTVYDDEGKSLTEIIEDLPAADKKVQQTATDNTNANYEILFSESADNVTKSEEARKSSRLLYNPGTKKLSLAESKLEVTGSNNGTTEVGGGSMTISRNNNLMEPQLSIYNEHSGGEALLRSNNIQIRDDYTSPTKVMEIQQEDIVLTGGTWDGTNTSLKTALANAGAKVLYSTSAPTSVQGEDGQLYVQLKTLDPYLDNFIVDYSASTQGGIDTELDISNLNECVIYIDQYQMVADVETLVGQYEEEVDFQNFSFLEITDDLGDVVLELGTSTGSDDLFVRKRNASDKFILSVVDANTTADAIDKIYIKDNGEWLPDNDSTIPSPTSEDVDKVLGATDVGEYGWIDSIRFLDSGASAEVYTDHISVSQAGYGGSSMTRDQIQISNIMGSSITMTPSDISLGSTWDGTNTSLKDAIIAASGGGSAAVYKTLAEYQALTQQQKEDPTKIYFVIDEGTKVSPTLNADDGNVAASSSKDGYYAWKAFSGSSRTDAQDWEYAWESWGRNNGEWISYTFSTTQIFSKVSVRTATMQVHTMNYYVEGSNDGTNWTNLIPNGMDHVSVYQPAYDWQSSSFNYVTTEILLDTTKGRFSKIRFRTDSSIAYPYSSDSFVVANFDIYAAAASNKPAIYYKNVLYTPDELPITSTSDTGKALVVNSDGVWDKGTIPPSVTPVEIEAEDYHALTTVEKEDPTKIYFVKAGRVITDPVSVIPRNPSSSNIDCNTGSASYNTSAVYAFDGVMNSPPDARATSAYSVTAWYPGYGNAPASAWASYHFDSVIANLVKLEVYAYNMATSDPSATFTTPVIVEGSTDGTTWFNILADGDSSFTLSSKETEFVKNVIPIDNTVSVSYIRIRFLNQINGYNDISFAIAEIYAYTGNVIKYDDSTYYKGIKHGKTIQELPELLSADEGKVLKAVNGKWSKDDIYRELTQAEYDALPSSKNSDGIIYFITDNS